MNEEKIILYHDDMDGIFSGAQILQEYPNTKYVKVNYSDNWETIKENHEINESSIVYIVDFTFKDGDMMEQINSEVKELIWIDHHPIATQDKHENIKGKREQGKSGALLTYEYLNNTIYNYVTKETTDKDIDVPEYILIVNDYDLWKHENINTKFLIEYLNLEVDNPLDVIVYELLNTKLEEEHIEIGKKIFMYKQKIRDYLIKDIRIVDTKFGRVGVVNRANDKSFTANDMLNKHEIDIAIVWSIHDARISCSVRSKKNLARPLAESLGGNGHDNASGISKNLKEGGMELLYELTMGLKKDDI
jgi:nanoRNase/pAp phosphatase (c-di-AMP/oligoRNAs hydrolase)